MGSTRLGTLEFGRHHEPTKMDGNEGKECEPA